MWSALRLTSALAVIAGLSVAGAAAAATAACLQTEPISGACLIEGPIEPVVEVPAPPPPVEPLPGDPVEPDPGGEAPVPGESTLPGVPTSAPPVDMGSGAPAITDIPAAGAPVAGAPAAGPLSGSSGPAASGSSGPARSSSSQSPGSAAAAVEVAGAPVIPVAPQGPVLTQVEVRSATRALEEARETLPTSVQPNTRLLAGNTSSQGALLPSADDAGLLALIVGMGVASVGCAVTAGVLRGRSRPRHISRH